MSGGNELKRLAASVHQRCPEARLAIDEASTARGPSFLDIWYRGAHAVVEWRPGQGFGLSRLRGDQAEAFGSGAEVVVPDAAQAERQLEKWLFAERPMVSFPEATVRLGLTPEEAKALARELTQVEKVLRGEQTSPKMYDPFDFEESVAERLERLRVAMPPPEVKVSAFSIDIYPVTIQQWRRYMEETGAPAPAIWENGRSPYPENYFVTGVSWKEASAYAHHYGLDLPAEAEWEHAARSGRDFFPWGNAYFPIGRISFQEPAREPYAVGSRPATASVSGLHDLVGYFGEFTRDLLRPYPGADAKVFYTHIAQSEQQRAVRGGFDVYQDATCVYRGGIGEEERPRWIKFRCVRRKSGRT